MINKIILILCFSLLIVEKLWGWEINKSNFKSRNGKTGFLVLAPDRGFIGNKETQSIFKQFNNEYLAKIVYMGREYNGLNSNYSKYIQKALSNFDELFVSNIIIF
jgi:hypothetical protein